MGMPPRWKEQREKEKTIGKRLGMCTSDQVHVLRQEKHDILRRARARGWLLCDDPLTDAIRIKSSNAMRKYHKRYDNTLYTRAVNAFDPQERHPECKDGMDPRVDFANRLIDHALALCGDPFYKVHWGFVTDGLTHNPDARAFLCLFA